MKTKRKPQRTLLREIERAVILLAVVKYGTREKACEKLGLATRTMTERLREYGVPPRAMPQITCYEIDLVRTLADEIAAAPAQPASSGDSRKAA